MVSTAAHKSDGRITLRTNTDDKTVAEAEPRVGRPEHCQASKAADSIGRGKRSDQRGHSQIDGEAVEIEQTSSLYKR